LAELSVLQFSHDLISIVEREKVLENGAFIYNHWPLPSALSSISDNKINDTNEFFTFNFLTA